MKEAAIFREQHAESETNCRKGTMRDRQDVMNRKLLEIEDLQN